RRARRWPRPRRRRSGDRAREGQPARAWREPSGRFVAPLQRPAQAADRGASRTDTGFFGCETGCVKAVAGDRLRQDLVDLVPRAGDVEQFSLRAARVLRRSVAFDGICMLSMDPATSLPTTAVSENGLPTSAWPRLAQIEIGLEDVNAFAG